jgi:hypothetical protein
LTSNIVYRNWGDLVCACTHRRGADQGDVEILDFEMPENLTNEIIFVKNHGMFNNW